MLITNWHAHKIFERLAHSDRKRFSTALLITIDGIYHNFQVKLEVDEHFGALSSGFGCLSHWGKQGTADALSNLIDSLNNAGDIHLKMQNYRQAMRYFAKKRSAIIQKSLEDFDLRSLRISIPGNALRTSSIATRQVSNFLNQCCLWPSACNAAVEESEINNLLNNMNTKSFDIKAFGNKSL